VNPGHVRTYTEKLLDTALEGLRAEFPTATISGQVIRGYAPTVLTKVAVDADLLVLGSHGHGRLHHAVLGSVSEQCVRRATCPVVVVPTAMVTAPAAEPVPAG
jgi:nucleotide-binding universal stress UspA family protein